MSDSDATVPSLSVIIPSYRSRELDRVIACVRQISPLEIIVVDSSPQPPAPLPDGVSLLHLPQRATAARARNEGAWRARGDFLLFIDSDVLVTERTASFIAMALEQSPTAVCGVYETDNPIDNFLSRLQNLILTYRLFERKGQATPLKSSSHFLFRRDAFESTGGFNEELQSGEDIEFFLRCEHLGTPVVTSREFTAVHLKKFSAAGLFSDYYWKAFNAFQARRRYPAVFRRRGVYLGRRLSLSWLAGALLPIFLGLGILISEWRVEMLVTAALCAAAPALLWKPLMPGQSILFKLRALCAWPIIGLAVATATAASAGVYLAKAAQRFVQETTDWVRAGWRVMLRTGMPVQIINYITARCNLRCEHCFYKDTLDSPNPGELSLTTLRRTTREIGPVLWYSLAGGEPFIRKDLTEVVRVVQQNCRPKVFSFPTNGWYVERTFRMTLRMLQGLTRGNLILFFSLDGPQAVHDRIRGQDSFARVRQTMARLRPLQRLYPNLYLNIIVTITAQNWRDGPAFIDELIRDFSPNAISINLFRYHSLEHPPIPGEVIDGYRETVEAYARHLEQGALQHYGFIGGRILKVKEILQKELIYRVAKYGEFVTPCTAGTLSYVINEDGRVSPCEILSESIGTIESSASATTFSQMVRTPEARKLRRWIRDTKCKCTYECAQTTNTLFSWPLSGRLALQFARSLVN